MRKFTLFVASLFLAVGAMAQITDANQLSNNKCYHITSKDGNRGAFYAKPGEGYLSHCGGTYNGYLNKDVQKDLTSTAQQFAFVSYEGKLYLWSVSEKKFAQKDGNFVKLVESTSDFVTVAANGSYFNVFINGTNKLNFSGGYSYGVYANYNSNDDGNNLVITEAGDFDPSEAIARLAGIESAITLTWANSTPWTDAEQLYSTVLNNNAMAYGIKYIETEITVGGARTATVTFQYTSGSCALNTRGVEVINELDRVVAGDYHVGKTGTNSTGNVYTVSVAEAGTYKVRCYATFGANDRADATNGNILVAFAAADAAQFSHDLTFAAGYSTLYLGYKVAIPEGVEAYVVESANSGWAHLTKIEDVIPSTTPVILKNVGNNTTYTFTYTENDAETVYKCILQGSIVDCYVTEEAYVLGIVEGEVGLYKAEMAGGVWLNNANKAYLPASVASGAASYSFRFGEGATAIENVVVENASNVIFDLTGRKVEAISAPGIYVVNGKKVLVK